VLTHDFPNKWPEFLDITLQLLQTNDATSVFSGIMCLLALCKVYRYKANEVRGDFDKVVSVSFPLLLNIGNGLINEESLEAGEMLRMILKAYKLAIYVSGKDYLGFN
jgi:importin-7